MATKKCSRCGVEYPATLEFFTRHARGRFGLQPHCRECNRELNRTRYHYVVDRILPEHYITDERE